MMCRRKTIDNSLHRMLNCMQCVTAGGDWTSTSWHWCCTRRRSSRSFKCCWCLNSDCATTRGRRTQQFKVACTDYSRSEISVSKLLLQDRKFRRRRRNVASVLWCCQTVPASVPASQICQSQHILVNPRDVNETRAFETKTETETIKNWSRDRDRSRD